jgi:hypothetical protein
MSSFQSYIQYVTSDLQDTEIQMKHVGVAVYIVIRETLDSNGIVLRRHIINLSLSIFIYIYSDIIYFTSWKL